MQKACAPGRPLLEEDELLEDEELPPLDEPEDDDELPEEDEELLEDDVVVDVPLKIHVLARSASLIFAIFSCPGATGNVEQSLAI